MIPLTDKGRAFLAEHEGLNQPAKVPPLETSGITIGYGYDLGQVSRERFMEDWSEVLPAHQVLRLRSVVGHRGGKARMAAPMLRDIRLTHEQAAAVFEASSWPRYAAEAAKAFPGLEQLVADTQLALVSLVYNRGGSLKDRELNTDDEKPELFRRQEMRAIADYVLEGNLPMIARMLWSMARLWEGTDAPGLVKRRKAEAALVWPEIAAEMAAAA